ncbi:hypothetical protein L3X37_04655 [Sabulilitoribacter arenilitoris]|uniref:Uncharacterized protein n=1 Tax=Wocania arenilitoris TaxID=2044858 RepID=A0AAE3JNX0_9FLAO|nr:hypothetical protein [Wocania arenilitoris]MCF7567655.1 hypothetical protein [Wocania arenilitoris]
MKTNLILFFTVLFFSCSPEEQEKIDALGINPPAWIQGTWIVKDDTLGQSGLKFTEKHFFKIGEEGTENSVMLSYIILQGLGSDVTVEEFIATNSYAIKVSTGYSDDWYRFTKISSEEISWDNYNLSTEPVVYVKRN